MLQRYKLLDQKTQRRLTFKRTSPTSIESDCAILDKFKNDLLSENTARDMRAIHPALVWRRHAQRCDARLGEGEAPRGVLRP